jgi:hypothetical protein
MVSINCLRSTRSEELGGEADKGTPVSIVAVPAAGGAGLAEMLLRMYLAGRRRKDETQVVDLPQRAGKNHLIVSGERIRLPQVRDGIHRLVSLPCLMRTTGGTRHSHRFTHPELPGHPGIRRRDTFRASSWRQHVNRTESAYASPPTTGIVAVPE